MSDERANCILKITGYLHRTSIPPRIINGDAILSQKFKEAHKKAAIAIGRSRATLENLIDALLGAQGTSSAKRCARCFAPTLGFDDRTSAMSLSGCEWGSLVFETTP